jgi:hypothetical protein
LRSVPALHSSEADRAAIHSIYIMRRAAEARSQKPEARSQKPEARSRGQTRWSKSDVVKQSQRVQYPPDIGDGGIP